MIPEIKRKWVAALRSDEYKQGNGNLRTQDGYCCLGVLCDIHRKTHPECEWKSVGNLTYAYTGSSMAESAVNYLPRHVMKWAELEYANPTVTDRHLATLNDQGKPFAEIANLIEANL